MKKKALLAAVLACACAFSFAGCGNKDDADNKGQDQDGQQLVTVKVGATAVTHQQNM